MVSSWPLLENRVRSLREARGLTQLALCEAVQMSRQTLSAIEAGRSEPSVAIALAIARVLGTPLEECFHSRAIVWSRPTRRSRMRVVRTATSGER